MSLTIQLRGVTLTQEQLDAVEPLVSEYMSYPGRSQEAFENDCIEVMSKAGCPFDISEPR